MIRSRRSAACMVLLLASACARDPQRVAAKFTARGDAYMANKRYREAQIEYRNALEQRPQDADSQVKLARAYVAAKDAPNAYRAYERATELDARLIDAHRWLADFLLRNGRFEDARRHAAAVLDDDAHDVRALIVVASADAALRDREGALRSVRQALAVDPASATAHTMLGALELSGGDRARARDAFVRATEVAPASPEPWVALAQFHIAVGEVGPAERALLQALAVASDPVPVHRWLGLLYVGVGRLADAEPHLKAVAAAGNEGRLLLADYYEAMRHHADALGLLNQVVADAAADPDVASVARLRRAAVWHASGERVRAHAELAALAKDEVRGADADALEAQLIVREGGDLDQALTHARDAVTRRPADAALHYVQGTVFLARGDLAEAATALRQARYLAPNALDVEFQLARVALARRDYRDAIDGATRVLRRSPSLDAVALLAQATRLSGDVPKARAIISDALKRQPNADALYVELGEIELAARRLDAARIAFERSLTVGVDQPRARRGLIAVELAAGRTAAAQAHIDQWLAEAPTAGDVPLLAAAVHLAGGDAATALADYERAAHTGPDSAGVHTAIGMLKAQDGDAKAAQQAYERAMSLDPKNGVAANNLAWIYADQGRIVEAVKLAQTAQRELGDRPAAVDTLGWMYYLQNDADRALALLEKASGAQPSNAVYRYHLGAALMKVNQRERGHRELQRALALSSTFQGVTDAKRLVEIR